MTSYAQKIAGWTEADILAIYEGGDPPERPMSTTGLAGTPISEETQAQALAAIYGLRDVPAKERRYLASLIESLPLSADLSAEESHKGADDGETEAG